MVKVGSSKSSSVVRVAIPKYVLIILVSIIAVFIIKVSNKDFKSDIHASNIEKAELMTHIRFLASDELRGRKPGTSEANIAARYIAEQFRRSGIKAFYGNNEFLQPVTYLAYGSNGLQQSVNCNNIMGYLEGADEKLKHEYIVLVAHYDHLGVISDTQNPGQDSIYNGARDNAIAVAALLYASKKLAADIPARSVIFLVTTGEEDGMKGSIFFSEHCPVPIENIVFVLNNDGGGFNDTTMIRVGGKNLIEFEKKFWPSLCKSDMSALPYPEELDYLYSLGDNITFARLEIPAVTISPGFNRIDDDILKYIHMPADEAGADFNYSYLLKFSRIYANVARSIASIDHVPYWKSDYPYNIY